MRKRRFGENRLYALSCREEEAPRLFLACNTLRIPFFIHYTTEWRTIHKKHSLPVYVTYLIFASKEERDFAYENYAKTHEELKELGICLGVRKSQEIDPSFYVVCDFCKKRNYIDYVGEHEGKKICTSCWREVNKENILKSEQRKLSPNKSWSRNNVHIKKEAEEWEIINKKLFS